MGNKKPRYLDGDTVMLPIYVVTDIRRHVVDSKMLKLVFPRPPCSSYSPRHWLPR